MHLRRLTTLPVLAVLLTFAAIAQTLPQGVQKVTSVEGITEYAFPNGLHVLLVPDNSKPKVTVNMVYLVGSRNEGYGETGMAHLLEHMVFKTTKSGREIFKELTDRTGGGNFNGGTSYDQTMYYETVNASDENLRWALQLEADRMVNMTMEKKDLDTEMTVVRNEMESGENNPLSVLQQKTMAAAYNFHNYGKTVIGARSDVERVPIANLAAFYQKYYQPDNAILVIAGQIDESKALATVAETAGRIPRPQRTLPLPYTVEPTQEGERSVILRRVGNIQAVTVVYHIPAQMHPDTAALNVLGQVLGGGQSGRLYKSLVDTNKAVGASFSPRGMHDPAVAMAFVQLKPDQSTDEARDIALKTIEGVVNDPPTQDEVDRAKIRLLKNIELTQTNSQSMAMTLGGDAGSGDWRLFFLERDEIKKVAPADVLRVAKAYLKPSNRTLGEFIPEKAPDRAEIPPTPDSTARFKDFKGGETVQQGEVFEPTPQNIESRVTRVSLPNGLKLVMMPKKTRGGMAVAVMNVRFGDEKSLFGHEPTGFYTGRLLMRGTKNKTRQQVQDEMDRLKAQISVSGSATGVSASVRTADANFAASLRFVRELLREPSFPEAEFEQIRQQNLASLESAKTEPTSLASQEMSRHMNSRYQHGDMRYTPTLDEDIEDNKKVTIEQVRKFYSDFYGLGEGELVIVGQFDPAQVQKLVTELFGDWKSPVPYERITNTYARVEPINRKIETPDKQNAIFLASMATKVTDDDPDAPALLIASTIIGGTPNSRLFQRIRVKDGLSYGANGGFSIPTKDDGGRFSANAIAAPQNMPKVEADFNEEITKALKDGFTAEEVEKAKTAWLDEQKVARTEETSLASLLLSRERWSRTMDWDAKREAAVSALTVQQVNEAFRKHIDPAAISIIKGGDFKKVGVYQQ